MTRDRILHLAILAIVLGLIVWIARNTYWTSDTVTSPSEGEAATNPFYSVERVLHAVGVRTRTVSSLHFLPPVTEVLYAGDLRGESLRTPLAPLQRWVENGGRLVITGYSVWSLSALQNWSGISPAHRDPTPQTARVARALGDESQECPTLTARTRGIPGEQTLRVCGRISEFGFASRRVPDWTLENAQGVQMLRIPIGRGSLIVIDPEILGPTAFLRDDDAEAFLEATQLGRGERANLFNPTAAEAFPRLLWRLGAPAVVCFGLVALLLILRNLPRFGPPAPVPTPARRSLGEQIRANARLAARTGRLGTLRDAVMVALDRVATDRVPGYRSLNVRQRGDALASRAGVNPADLVTAFTANVTDAHSARAAIRILEHTRRSLAAPPPLDPGTAHDR